MTDEELSSLVIACRRYAESVFTIAELAETVAMNCPDIYRTITWRAWVAQVRKAATAPANGMPWAGSVDGHGTYKPTSLFDVAEYRYVIRQYMLRGQANKNMAYKFAQSCRDVHDVWIDPEEELGQAQS